MVIVMNLGAGRVEEAHIERDGEGVSEKEAGF